jgi:hypothetical protein
MGRRPNTGFVTHVGQGSISIYSLPDQEPKIVRCAAITAITAITAMMDSKDRGCANP